jgi:hypothetical protein
MAANEFSQFLDGEVGHTRRIGHSAYNYLQTVHANPFGNHSSVSLNNLTNVGGQAMNVMGVVAGSAAIGFATGAVATGAFAAAVAGPQAAVVLGVISIGMAVKGAYSNREASHKVLSKYVYNMVDDVAPLAWTKESLKEAAKAANYLLSQGQNQFELVGSKFQTASATFTTYVGALNTKVDKFNAAKADAVSQRIAAGPRATAAATATRLQREVRNEWIAASKSGGAIFEFVRRCSHTGNYLQAPHILHLAILEELSTGAVVGNVSLHAGGFKDSPIVTSSRGMFTRLDTLYRANKGPDKIFA